MSRYSPERIIRDEESGRIIAILPDYNPTELDFPRIGKKIRHPNRTFQTRIAYHGRLDDT